MGVDQQSFGVRLRTLREQTGLSQEELAERAGLSSHAVSALERGTRTRPYPHTVRALADALGLEGEARSGLISSVPARTRAARPTADRTGPGIPVPPTRLIGRDDDLRRLVGLLDEHRLITLTGPGGVGKTRLSLALARTVQDRFADGVVYVELAALRDPDAVVPAVLDTVGVTTTAGEEPVAAFCSWAADRELLLILDNAEQVAAAAPQVAELVATVPGLTVLGPTDPTLRGGAISFEIDGVHPHDVAQVLDSRGVAVRAGHSCAKPAHARFGVQSSTRMSSYLYTTPAEIDAFIEGLEYVRSYFRLG